MNWYKIRVLGGRSGYAYVGSSPDSVEALIERASRGEYLRLDNLLYSDRGDVKEWAEWDKRDVPSVYINPANVVAIQPFQGDPRTIPR